MSLSGFTSTGYEEVLPTVCCLSVELDWLLACTATCLNTYSGGTFILEPVSVLNTTSCPFAVTVSLQSARLALTVHAFQLSKYTSFREILLRAEYFHMCKIHSIRLRTNVSVQICFVVLS